jgi:type IV secretory pathway VirB10-like protein
MKRSIIFVLVLAMVLTFAACGPKDPEPTPTPDPTPVTTPEPTATPEPTTTPDAATPTPDATPTPETKPTPEVKPTPAPTPEPTPDGDTVTPAKTADELQTMLEAILAGCDEVNSGTFTELAKDNDSYQYNLYIDYVEGYECMTYAPMITSTAYFVALVSVPSDVDAEALAAAIESGADPNKWICVSADQVDAVANGNVILFYMVDSATYSATAETLTNNFLAQTV